MDAASILRAIQAELDLKESFTNHHGITFENLGSFLCDPFPVKVDPDDTVSGIIDMWAIGSLNAETLLVFNPQDRTWGVAEVCSDGHYIQLISGDSLGETLSGM